MNPLDAEPLIIARLKEKLPGVTIASTAAIAGALELPAMLPAVFVHPASAEVSAVNANGQAHMETSTWFVTLVIQNIADPVDLLTDYQPAGQIISAMLAALAGWVPSGAYRPMRYAGRDETAVEPGHVEFPVRFTLRRPFTNYPA